jgi:ribonuclease Z
MRVHLGSANTLNIIGPSGAAQNIFHKIHGYVWNLAETVELQFRVTELEPLRSYQLLPQTRYTLEEIRTEWPVIDSRSDWDFSFQPLQHLNITSIGYRVFTPDHWKVDEDALAKSKLRPGPWLKEIKAKETGSIVIDDQSYEVADLRKQLLFFARGYSISYITDAIYEGDNIAKMIHLAAGSDHLFCESSFLKEDEYRARKTHHLTTVQAATIAKEANVKQLHLFHFSRRYAGLEHVFLREAKEIFPHTSVGLR